MKPLAVATANDERADQFTVSSKTYSKTIDWIKEEDDNEQWIPLFDHSPADVTFVPMSLANPLIDIGSWLFSNEGFLECAFPILMEYLEREHNATIHSISSCTAGYRVDRHNYVEWTTNQCFGGDMREESKSVRPGTGPYDAYHPIKISTFGTFVWDLYFDHIVLGV